MGKSKQLSSYFRLRSGGHGVSICTVAASALLMQGAALAQQSTSTPKATGDALEEVVVTGIRASLRSSMEVKRDSIQVVDAISAEDINDFPDKNVSEALQRVTGVQISRQDGEGRGVSIRGADPSLNRVEINGSSALSLTVGGGRDVDFRDIPVEFISRLEVVKSATPDMTEGGVGGTVRVLTRRPFDNTEPYLAGSAQMVYSDLAEEYDPKFALIGSRLFLNDTLGVLLSATWEERHLYSNNARTTGWLRRNQFNATGTQINPPGRQTDINGDGTTDWIPEIPRYIIDRRETTRPAFSGVVEWRPNDGLSLFAEGTYTEAKEKVSSMLMQLSGSSGIIDYSRSTVGADNTIDHLEIVSGAIGTTQFPIDLAYRNINGSLKRDQYTTAAGARWETGNFVLDGRLSYAKAEVQNDEKNSTATIFGLPRAIIDYTDGEGAPNFTFPGIDTTTGQLVNQLAAVFNPRTNSQDEQAAEFNVEYKPDSNWITSLKTGARFNELTMDSILYQRTIQLSSRAASSSAGNTTTVATPQATIQNIIDENSGVNRVQFFETGDLGFGGGIRFWNDNNDDTYNATVAASGIAGGLDPYAANPNANTNGTYQNYLDTWSVEEKTKSAYVQGSFAFNDIAVPISGTLGVRYVDTDTLSSGYNRVQSGTGANVVVTFPQASREGGYEKWLPSLNMRFNFTDQLVGRLTAGKVMARPNPNQLALRRTTDVVGETGSRGNPDLQPFEADQYDLGVEWYFSSDDYVAVTLFRKEISSFILNVSSGEDAAGEPCPDVALPGCFNISRPINGTDAVTINGVEAGGQWAFSFLPAPFSGFGALANITYSDDEGFKGTDLVTGEILPFPGLSKLSYNASLYYEGKKLSARASYNWREEWLITASGRGGLPEFNEDYGSLDASLSYSFIPNLTLFAEAINLLDEQRIENNNPYRRIGNETFGKRYFVGLRGKF